MGQRRHTGTVSAAKDKSAGQRQPGRNAGLRMVSSNALSLSFRNGQAVRVGECDLYFATAGREAVIAALPDGSGLQCLRWDRTEPANEIFAAGYGLSNGAIQQTETPSFAESAETAGEFLAAPGTEAMQPLLYNRSGEAKIEGEANARELRAALASMAS